MMMDMEIAWKQKMALMDSPRMYIQAPLPFVLSISLIISLINANKNFCCYKQN